MRSLLNERRFLQLSQLLLIAGMLQALPGCGDTGPPKADVYPVSGKVTGGTGSLTGLLITFHPAKPSGMSAIATIKEGGAYTLESIDGRAGCAAGSYKVTFSLSPEATKEAMMKAMSSAGKGKGGPPQVESPYPAKYQTAETSDKTVEVKPETNTIDITI